MNTVFEHWLHISASLSLDTESSRTFQVKTFICQEFLWHPVFFHISTKKKVSWRRASLLQTSNIPRTGFSAWCPSVGHFPELRNRKCRASTCIGSLKICFGASSGVEHYWGSKVSTAIICFLGCSCFPHPQNLSRTCCCLRGYELQVCPQTAGQGPTMGD